MLRSAFVSRRPLWTWQFVRGCVLVGEDGRCELRLCALLKDRRLLPAATSPRLASRRRRKAPRRASAERGEARRALAAAPPDDENSKHQHRHQQRHKREERGREGEGTRHVTHLRARVIERARRSFHLRCPSECPPRLRSSGSGGRQPAAQHAQPLTSAAAGSPHAFGAATQRRHVRRPPPLFASSPPRRVLCLRSWSGLSGRWSSVRRRRQRR